MKEMTEALKGLKCKVACTKPLKPVHPQSIADLVHGYKEKHDKLTAEVDELHAKWRTRIMERNIANAAYKAARAAAKKIESSAL